VRAPVIRQIVAMAAANVASRITKVVLAPAGLMAKPPPTLAIICTLRHSQFRYRAVIRCVQCP